ncbi:patatin-like phospholipase family protein [Collimonas arenae]|uniref:Patatin-like phospholipase family protein n=3 Tax=Oxalobacteraceae TaxID=75682 RepID=A0A127QQP9_9BURK|nr:patatin-like phospholipase family protein [Collimonas arenae]AMP11952.1 patatin-like phospholipase family protein [Collimonas arenae]AMP17206.1 patatin-like phospholipase family protein [Collimonas pratensis]
MIFHMGALRHLAEKGRLEDVRRISTVSGGSLLVGLIFQESDMQWPSSEKFLFTIYPALRRKICSRSLQWGALRQLIKPWNLRFFLSRANLLALALQKEWDVTAKLSDIPALPEWSINGTTAETGKRFRFKHDSMGDYCLGYASTNTFPLAKALAVSAAFPGGFGPLTLNATKFNWRKRPTWEASAEAAQSVNTPFNSLHLYDGGVYDNLGLEPFLDAGKGISKIDGEAIIVFDAGAPLRSGFSALALNPWRLKRIADIMADQAHSLRVRTFHNYLRQAGGNGAYLPICKPAGEAANCISAAFAAGFPTTLRRTTIDEFDAIATHGYDVACTEPMFHQDVIPVAV